jgi:hypothetical protein
LELLLGQLLLSSIQGGSEDFVIPSAQIGGSGKKTF